VSDKDKDETTPPLADGGQIIYAREDSGLDFPALGLLISPGEPLTIGQDLDIEFAQRLVDEGICTPFTPKRKPKTVEPAPPTVGTPVSPQESAKVAV
jgi:hypothetical protein